MNWKGRLAVVLAAVAGVVDAAGLAGVGRYSSHMTGTTTHSMVGFVGGDHRLLVFGILAVACFLAGAIGAGVVLTHPAARRPSATLAVLVGTETALILIGGLVMALLPAGPWDAMAVIGGFAAAMGVQNAASTYLLSPHERTTHVTSNMTDFGCELGMRLRGVGGGGHGQGAGLTGSGNDGQCGVPDPGLRRGCARRRSAASRRRAVEWRRGRYTTCVGNVMASHDGSAREHLIARGGHQPRKT